MTTAEKTSPEEHSRSTTAVQGQSAGVHQKWRILALGRHLQIVPHGGTDQDPRQSLFLRQIQQTPLPPRQTSRIKTPTC